MKTLTALFCLVAFAACGAEPVDAASDPKALPAAPVSSETGSCCGSPSKQSCCGGCVESGAPATKPVETKQQ